jgi:hypothetical protein
MPLPASLLADLDVAAVLELGVVDGANPVADDDKVVVRHVLSSPERIEVDPARLRTAVGGALDLIIDHADHDHERTRWLFERLVPLLAPGGCYVIDGPVDEGFALELALAMIEPRVLDRVVIEVGTIAAWRSSGELDGDRFVLAEAYTDPFGLLS